MTTLSEALPSVADIPHVNPTTLPLDIEKARELAKEAARTIKPLRTEQTIRHAAKDFAAAWWDESINSEQLCLNSDLGRARTAAFRAMWPDRKIYVTLCWPFFYKVARDHLISMLGNPQVSEYMKERIHAAILEDRNKKGN